MKRLLNTKLLLIVILLTAASFRFYNLNWDNGHFMHPDERAIIMEVAELKFPTGITEFLSSESSWNPKFFAYGSFPMYLLRVTGNALSALNPEFGQFHYMTLLGRVFSAFADTVSVFLVFLIGKKLFGKNTGLLAAFFYAISVLPIQLSHYFAVDTLLTCFILATLYFLLRFYEKPRPTAAMLVGLFFGLSLATKVSAIVILVSIGTTLAAELILIFLKSPHRPKHWLPHLPKSMAHLAKYGSVIFMATLVTFAFFEPYALIDFQTFRQHTAEQSVLTVNPFHFPYTLQFVGKIPYVYEFKNIFLWGLGPLLAALSFTGALAVIFKAVRREKNKQFAKELIILVFFFAYIFVVGKFAVGFMRYMLPVYPLFCLFAGVAAYQLFQLLTRRIKNQNALVAIGYLFLVSVFIWPLSFIQIYTRPNPRIQASEWIYANITPDKVLAVEHWDDQLPIGQPLYPTTALKLYDPDTDEKWAEIEQQLAFADYIIIASGRLSVPLQKLTNCAELPAYRCYPRTAVYYKQLFSGELGFKKVAEFTNYPTVPLLHIPINDETADENFTIFDHPKVMIFQKTSYRSTM